MNGPLFAATIVSGVVLVTLWAIAMLKWEPRSLIRYTSFLVWALPLFYFGGWAKGIGAGETTAIAFVLAFLWFLSILRDKAEDWFSKRVRTQKRREQKSLLGTKRFKSPRHRRKD
jgi:hypothetical protein